MKVCFDYAFNLEALFFGIGKILRHVTLWVNNDCAAADRVANKIRRVRQTRQVVLLQHQRHIATTKTPTAINVTSTTAAAA